MLIDGVEPEGSDIGQDEAFIGEQEILPVAIRLVVIIIELDESGQLMDIFEEIGDISFVGPEIVRTEGLVEASACGRALMFAVHDIRYGYLR